MPAERETREETALHLQAGALLVVAWTAARAPGRRDRLAFLFAGPHITHIYLHLIRPGPREVDAWQLAAQPAAAHLLHPLQAQRLQARSTTTGNTIYLEQPAPTGRLPRGRWRAPATTHATSEQTRQNVAEVIHFPAVVPV